MRCSSVDARHLNDPGNASTCARCRTFPPRAASSPDHETYSVPIRHAPRRRDATRRRMTRRHRAGTGHAHTQAHERAVAVALERHSGHGTRGRRGPGCSGHSSGWRDRRAVQRAVGPARAPGRLIQDGAAGNGRTGSRRTICEWARSSARCSLQRYLPLSLGAKGIYERRSDACSSAANAGTTMSWTPSWMTGAIAWTRSKSGWMRCPRGTARPGSTSGSATSSRSATPSGRGPQNLARWASRSVLMGVVIRTDHPGEKHDEMVVLVGPQGIGKSTAWAWLLPGRAAARAVVF